MMTGSRGWVLRMASSVFKPSITGISMSIVTRSGLTWVNFGQGDLAVRRRADDLDVRVLGRGSWTPAGE